MRRFIRREYTADYVALAYVLVYYAWLFLHAPGTRWAVFLGEVTFYPLGLAVGWAYLRNARLGFVDRRSSLAWGILGSGALLLWLVGNTWPRLVDVFGASAYPAWVGYLEIVQHLLLIAACLVFPGRAITRQDRPRFFMDVGLILVAGFALAVHFGLRVSLQPSPASPVAVAVAQSVLDWAAFVTAAVGVLHKRDATTRLVLGFLLLANALYLIANHTLSGMVVYKMGDLVDGLWFAAWIFRWTAARVAGHRLRGAVGAREREAASAAPGYQSSVFPYVLVAGAFTLLIIQVLGGDRQYIGLLAFSAAVMAGLLLLRQLAELRENRRLFAAQLAQEGRFRSLVQHSSDVVLVVASDGRLTYVGPSAARVLGEGAVALGGRLADLLPAGDLASLTPIFDGTARPTGPLQSRMQTSAGDWREMELVATDLRTDPAVAGIVLTCRDVTDRNEFERQLQHAQKLDAVGHLAGGLAHDFNNVLTAIRGYAELLRDQLPEASPMAADVGHIEQAVDRATTVTRKLLAFSRKQAVQRTVLNLNTVLSGIEPLLRQLLTTRTQVHLDLDPNAWLVKIDPGQIEQVVINLATNARDAMPAGGILQVVTANRVIANVTPAVGDLPAGDYVALVVSDQGAGMSPEVRARIFEPFFTTKSKDKGMGLGLAMVHGIVTDSGGHISVDSFPGRGTTFTILLPRTREASASVFAADQHAVARGGAETVLLVDDEFGVRTIARRMLERAGYTVIEAASGREALELVATSLVTIDVLLTDMVMPGLHGRDLIAQFRKARPGVPVVSITGFAGDGPAEASVDSEAITVVTKPFSSVVLLRAVAAACAAHPRG